MEEVGAIPPTLLLTCLPPMSLPLYLLVWSHGSHGIVYMCVYSARQPCGVRMYVYISMYSAYVCVYIYVFSVCMYMYVYMYVRKYMVRNVRV